MRPTGEAACSTRSRDGGHGMAGRRLRIARLLEGLPVLGHLEHEAPRETGAGLGRAGKAREVVPSKRLVHRLPTGPLAPGPLRESFHEQSPAHVGRLGRERAPVPSSPAALERRILRLTPLTHAVREHPGRAASARNEPLRTPLRRSKPAFRERALRELTAGSGRPSEPRGRSKRLQRRIDTPDPADMFVTPSRDTSRS